METALSVETAGDADGVAGWLTHDRSRKLGLLGLVILACVLAYLLTFIQVGFPVMAALQFACLNMIAASIPGSLTWWLTQRMARTAPTLQAVLHVPMALAFSWAWYIAGRYLGAGLEGLRGGSFEPYWLPEAALAWQLTQGISVYAALVAAAYAALFANRNAEPHQLTVKEDFKVSPVELPPVNRFLARSGDGFSPIDVVDIVMVEGADDYSEVTTVSGERRLVRLSLKAFEAQLGSANFVRVHRSVLIALDQLLTAEPAGGGRMLLHLAGGHVLQTSREGARRLRHRMI